MKKIVDVLLRSTLRNFHVDLRNLSSDILETSFLTIGQSKELHREKFDSRCTNCTRYAIVTQRPIITFLYDIIA